VLVETGGLTTPVESFYSENTDPGMEFFVVSHLLVM
jgi:hypothetical protein